MSINRDLKIKEFVRMLSINVRSIYVFLLSDLYLYMNFNLWIKLSYKR